jgi:single-strand DNA-binding protein
MALPSPKHQTTHPASCAPCPKENPVSFPITFKGRLGAEPEITFASNGTAIGKMRVVTNGRRLVDGTWEDTDTSWWNVTAFGRTAEAIADNLHKGDLIMVTGKIKQRDWEKDGIKRTTADIVADEVATVVKANPKAVPDNPGAGWATDDKAPF